MVAAAAEVAAGAAASVVAAVAGLLAAEVAAAAAVVAAAAGSVASGSVPAWPARVARAADPGERAACAKPHEKRAVTVGGSLPVYPNNQTNSVSAATSQKCTKAAF